MLPLMLGGAALGGGLANYFGNDAKNQAAQDAYDKAAAAAKAGHAKEMGIADQYDWRNRMNAASEMRQDANAYETNSAIQGGLAAYGGSPLSGGARNAVYDRLQQQARGNYQTSLANANSMLGTDMNARLGIEGNLTNRLYNVEGQKADAKASELSGWQSALQGVGQGLILGSSVAGLMPNKKPGMG